MKFSIFELLNGRGYSPQILGPSTTRSPLQLRILVNFHQIQQEPTYGVSPFYQLLKQLLMIVLYTSTVPIATKFGKQVCTMVPLLGPLQTPLYHLQGAAQTQSPLKKAITLKIKGPPRRRMVGARPLNFGDQV